MTLGKWLVSQFHLGSQGKANLRHFAHLRVYATHTFEVWFNPLPYDSRGEISGQGDNHYAGRLNVARDDAHRSDRLASRRDLCTANSATY